MQKGFTLIELLLYVGLAAGLLLASSFFYSLLLQSRTKNQVITEVESQGQQAMQLILQTIRNAENVNSPAAGGSAQSLSLDVVNPSLDPTLFDLASNAIRITEATTAAPTVISKGTAAAGTAASISPGYPVSPQANDIIFILAISNQPNGIGIVDTPSGFTEAAQGTFQNNTPTNRGRAALFWKRAAGGESGTVSISRTGDTGSDGVFFAQMYLVRGAETSGNPWDGLTARYGPGNPTVTWDAVPVSGSERTLLGFAAQADDASTVDPPSGWSALSGDTTGSGTDAEVRLAYLGNVSSDGQVTATGGETEGWATFHVSMKPSISTATPVALTNTLVEASDLTFSNLTRPATPGVIRVQFTLTHFNPENRGEYNYAQTFYDTASLRY
jgi:Tfp pilus assembly protein PilW